MLAEVFVIIADCAGAWGLARTGWKKYFSPAGFSVKDEGNQTKAAYMEERPEAVDRRDEIDHNIFGNELSEVYDERLRGYVLETLNRLPEEDLDTLLYNRVIRIIQPVVNTVIELNDLNLSLRDEKGRITLVVFRSELCDKPSAEITYVIAHEFAHVFLGHATNQINVDEGCETEADTQVIKWGFEEELRETPYNYIHGNGRPG